MNDDHFLGQFSACGRWFSAPAAVENRVDIQCSAHEGTIAQNVRPADARLILAAAKLATFSDMLMIALHRGASFEEMRETMQRLELELVILRGDLHG